MCQSGRRRKKTNHSLRKSTATELTAAGLPPHKVIRITGHKNVSSIQDYDTELTNKEHRQISHILCGGGSRRLISTPNNRSTSASQSHTFSSTKSTSVSTTSHTITRSTDEYGEENEQICRPRSTTTSTNSDMDNQNQDKPSTSSSTGASGGACAIPSLSGATFNNCVLNFNFK